MVCCVRLHLMLSAKALGMLVKSAHKNWKKAKEDKFCAETFDAFLKLGRNEGNVDMTNMLSDSRKKSSIKQNSVETSSQVCRVLRSSGKNIKETRWQFNWKDPHFSRWVQSIVYPQIVCFPWLLQSQAILPFQGFCFHYFSPPPLEKSWLRPCMHILYFTPLAITSTD